MLTFYDSGIGGLTVVNQYLKLKPSAKLRYYGDFEILPMGDKSQTEIVQRVKSVATIVFEDSKLMVLVCNTASVNTIRELQQNWLPENFPSNQILSISKPITELLEYEYSNFKTKELVILATKATIESDFYQQELRQIGFANVAGVSCVGLCDLIEELINQNNVKDKQSQFLSLSVIHKTIQAIKNSESFDKEIVAKIITYLEKLQLPANSLILLACTHYPIIQEIIQSVYPSCIIIDPSHFIAKKLVEYEVNHPEYF